MMRYIISRLDPFQKQKDSCERCGKPGYDYTLKERRKQLKTERIGMVEELIRPLSDETRLNAPLQVLETLEKVKSQPVEILRIGDEYYTNLPDKTAAV